MIAGNMVVNGNMEIWQYGQYGEFFGLWIFYKVLMDLRMWITSERMSKDVIGSMPN